MPLLISRVTNFVTFMQLLIKLNGGDGEVSRPHLPQNKKGVDK